MDVEAIRDSPIGTLVPISGTDRGGRPYAHVAYLPDPLPASVDLTPQAWLRLVEAEAALARLDEAAMLIPEPRLLIRPSLRREAQSTSALEGTYAPFEDVLESDVHAAAPSPDILIHPTLGVEGRYSLNLATDGPPGLVMEFLSPATARSRDLNAQAPDGKPRLYEACGIPEYLTFDALSDYVPGQIRAWRLGPAGTYIPWEPDASGHWVSAVLGISFVPAGRWLDVYDGQRQRDQRKNRRPERAWKGSAKAHGNHGLW